jgi:hypothetical protein
MFVGWSVTRPEHLDRTVTRTKYGEERMDGLNIRYLVTQAGHRGASGRSSNWAPPPGGSNDAMETMERAIVSSGMLPRAAGRSGSLPNTRVRA